MGCGRGGAGIIMEGIDDTLGGEVQTVPRAELWAMYVALSYARKPFRIVTKKTFQDCDRPS